MDSLEGVECEIFFFDKWRTLESIWNLIHLHSFPWTSSSKAFEDTPLNILQLD